MVNSGSIIWLALGLIGTALVVTGAMVYRGGKTVRIRSLAGASVALGVVMWAALTFTLPVSQSSKYGTDSVVAADLAEPNLAISAEARI